MFWARLTALAAGTLSGTLFAKTIVFGPGEKLSPELCQVFKNGDEVARLRGFSRSAGKRPGPDGQKPDLALKKRYQRQELH
ncbi:hypothetical protein HW090_10880 [Pseudomonas sp. ABC1]|uniref:hypothetical protein n=1 Tax=Pseudomonas sp. ABC1 TaxID=2748080 RepID=UPI0015C31711|nr:hypothetical protein [Pseudomonas sp. ABC1]QLF93670.1 hypothetical protein HW090_10880 [Pseudomonas sp. ABC1]